MNTFENEISKLSEEEFPKRTEILKKKVKDGVNLEIFLPEAYSLVREASRRTRGKTFRCSNNGWHSSTPRKYS